MSLRMGALAILAGSGILGSCATLGEAVCRLEDQETAVAWAVGVVNSGNDEKANPDLRFVDGTLTFDSIDEYPEGYLVRFSAAGADGGDRRLFLRMHGQSCTYEVGGGAVNAMSSQ